MRDMPRGWTIGTELELSDCERDTPLPHHSVWDRDDYTMVNSNGVANDPKGKLWKYGGEINTAPTNSIQAQSQLIADTFSVLTPRVSVNYRANFHVHIRVPGLANDLPLLKKAIAYTHKWDQKVFDMVDPIPEPDINLDPAALAGARVRYRRRRQSHHHRLSPTQYNKIMAATYPEELYHTHVPISWEGVPQYHLAQRCGINFRALWECPASTIEFRHFSMSLEVWRLHFAMEWCVKFLQEALGDQSEPSLSWIGIEHESQRPFPRQELYDHWLETRYRASSRRYHTEDQVRKVLEQWRQEGTL